MNKATDTIMKAISLTILFLYYADLHGQCTLPEAETCEEAHVFCSLDELNGYSCNNSSTIPLSCDPLCSGGGVGHNTGWWAFVADGGNVDITLTVGGCSTNQGLQWGVRGACVCGEEVICHSIPCAPPNSENTRSANLKPCKTYYLWVDGCTGDICDFTITTSAGLTPKLDTFGFINDISSGVIGPICKGVCDVPFFVNDNPEICSPSYLWTVDGVEMSSTTKKVLLDFPDEGDFTVCVKAYLGNHLSGSICSQSASRCVTVQVRPIKDTFYDTRKLCYEQTLPDGFQWHSQKIKTSGTYIATVKINCCDVDSIVDFSIIDSPKKPVEIFYLGCNNDPYIDPIGRPHLPCKDKIKINLPDASNPFGCDSVIYLSAVKLDLWHGWQINYDSNKATLSPNITLNNPCNLGETYEFKYKWYKANDPLKTSISSAERLIVDLVSEDYCLDLEITIRLNGQTRVCSRTFCEKLNESGVYLSDRCYNAPILCSLDALDGYPFRNTSREGTDCESPCYPSWWPLNTSWWAFVTAGGIIKIQMMVGNCDVNQGILFGISGDCNCEEDLGCAFVEPNDTGMIEAVVLPCKKYYLYVSETFYGSVCDLTFNTFSSGAPVLSALGYINDEPLGIIESVCKGTCNYAFYVNPQETGCEVTYKWTLDGVEVGGTKRNILLDFPEEGDFKICVSAFIGDLINGVCSQEGPRCVTVKVRPLADRFGQTRYLCAANILGAGYLWHTQSILSPGVYRESFYTNYCCPYDSVVEFRILDTPKVPVHIIYADCDNLPFSDMKGIDYYPCQDKLKISLPDPSNSFGCDSVIFLTTLSMEIQNKWNFILKDGKAILSPGISPENPCKLGESYEYNYKWYKKSDTTRTVISTSDKLIVDTISEEYCVDVEIVLRLDTFNKTCYKTYCESIDESGIAASETCSDAPVFCSVKELNEFKSRSVSNTPSPCDPLCANGGIGLNTNWIGFVPKESISELRLTIGSCEKNNGLQWGLNGDCQCNDKIICFSDPYSKPNSSHYVQVNLVPCKTYYFWVNGFDGDICDYTINTTLQDPPELDSLGYINEDQDGIIDQICEGACDISFYIKNQEHGCTPNYIWTLDGVNLNHNSSELSLDFPVVGDFKLCVSAYIGNSENGTICSNAGPVCSTIKVRPFEALQYGSRTLCFEQVHPDGFPWFTQRIFTSGIYQEHIVTNNCCVFDSIVEFTVTDMEEPPIDVFHISCDGEPYIDFFGREYLPCQDRFEIVLPGLTQPNGCDSSISLSSVHVKVIANWVFQRTNRGVDLIPNLTVANPCNLGESYQLEYRWYKSNDPLNTISTDERLHVDLIAEDYCLELIVTVTIDTLSVVCLKTFCETFNESFYRMADVCDSVQVFCSLDELNGFTGSNWSLIPGYCGSVCSQGGVTHNTNWLGFITQGGGVDFKLTTGWCATYQGLQFGIWADCICGEELFCHSIPCLPPYSETNFTVTLKSNKIYYFFVDGCSGDICDFTLNTSGGGIPTLNALGFINNNMNKIIEPVCTGACDVRLFIEPQPANSEPNYFWTLDGLEVGDNRNEIKLDFHNEGDFEICVTAFVGNPKNKSICSQQGPQCATVRVRAAKELTNQHRNVCPEILINGSGMDSICVYKVDGTYRCEYKDSTCCKIVETGIYTVLNAPVIKDVYFISCDGTQYVDFLGNPHSHCADHKEIVFPGTTDIYKCDSSIILTSVNADHVFVPELSCNGKLLQISPGLKIAGPCNLGETYSYQYKWFRKNDPTTILSTDEYFDVEAKNDEYCVEVSVRVQLQSEISNCVFTHCETFNEGNYFVDAGRDFKQLGLTSKMKGSFGQNGNWKMISGPGIILFENASNPKTRIKASEYGSYCLTWSATDTTYCLKDTVCVQFYKAKTTNPGTPSTIFDDRDDFSNEEEDIPLTIFTPNLISADGVSYVAIDNVINTTIDYHWYDIYGRMIIHESIQSESQLKMQINSPVHSGFYFLVFEIKGIEYICKVCVFLN